MGCNFDIFKNKYMRYNRNTTMNFENYKKQQKELFDQWSKIGPISNVEVYNEFTWDGIVATNIDEWDRWVKSPVKILYLLKEAYDEYCPEIPEEIRGKF
jgi:hypothetical protein